MAILTLTQAARAVGVARSTIYRAIRSGRLSATNQPDGSRGVDTAELMRVYGPLQGDMVRNAPEDDAPLLRARIEALERENVLLREMVQASRDEVQASRERESKLIDAVPKARLEGPKGKRRKGKKKGR